MSRRKFIKNAGISIGIPFLLNGFSFKALGRNSLFAKLLSSDLTTDKVLVLIQLSGGNDGINTVIPIDQYSTYYSLRSNIALPQTSLIKLNNATGLHPAMTALKNLYDEGEISLIQGVSYPSPNFSHFRATDIWLTASNYDQYLDSGWAGRYLNYEFPNYPVGYPNDTMPDPPAIQIGAVTSLGLQGNTESMAIAIQDPTTFYQLVSGSPSGNPDNTPATPAGNETIFIRQVEMQSQDYAKQVKTAADKAKNIAIYPANNTLSDQLKIVARLIAGGLKTRVYLVSLGGFDLHSAEIQSGDATKGAHATLLGRLSDAISAFQDDLTQLKIDQSVIGMTFSEFGRRAASNASLGTDHGTSEPVFVFGKNVLGGIIGSNPSLTDLTGGNLKMQYDFRQIYSTILSKWFLIDQKELSSVILTNFDVLPILKSTTGVQYPDIPNNSFNLSQNYPNPFNPSTMIEYDIPQEEKVDLTIFDIGGNIIGTLVNKFQTPGHYRVQFDGSNLASGTYIYQLTVGSYKTSKKMNLIK